MAEATNKAKSKTTASEEKKVEKAVQATEVKQAKNSDGGIKAFMFGIGGAVIAVLLCCICCCVAFFAMASTDDFKDGYCESYLEEQGSFRDEPFGLCDDYKPSFYRY